MRSHRPLTREDASMRRVVLPCVLLLLLAPALRGQEPPEESMPELDTSGLRPALETGGHMSTVIRVYFTRGGKELLSVGRDNTARFWDVRSGQPLRTVRFDGSLLPEF